MKRIKPILDPDRQNLSETYWNDVLASHGLSMDRGKATHKVSLRGGITELVVAEKIQYQKDSGQTKPPGKGPDE